MQDVEDKTTSAAPAQVQQAPAGETSNKNLLESMLREKATRLVANSQGALLAAGYDTDKDGKVELDEFRASLGNPSNLSLLVWADEDHSGRLDTTELKALNPRRIAQLNR